MEVTECTKLVLNRIQNLEPENATKIIGYLLLKHTHQEIVEFAFGPDNLIISLINEAKSYLTSSPKPNNSRPMELLADHPLHHMSVPATISRPFSSHSSFCVPAPYWEPGLSSDQQSLVQNLDFPPPAYTDLVRGLHKQADFMGSEEHSHPLDPLGPDFSSNYCYQEAVLNGELGSRNSLRSPPSLPEFPMKACHYFHKGYCRHGINCRFSHGQIIPDGFSQIYNPNYNELGNEDNAFPPGSLEKLEMEITELLRSRGGMPVSIASLPILYLEKYGKVLQAEGYLTESQRHGKAGFSLTKLLARLKNSIQLIDRPHGQHSVVLAEDAPKFMDYRNERSEQEAVLASSHQIYLTFPAESTFSEEDVLNYFKQYGPVRDVRIPRQEKRMFGFVSFLYPETVRLILSRGHPHYICGARVLVKPYKEKSKLIDRRYNEKVELPMYYPSQYFESDPDLNAIPRICDSSRLLKKQLIDEHEHALELLRRRLFDMQLTCKQMAPQPYIGFMTEELKVPEVRPINPPVAVNNGTMPDGIARETSNDHGYQDCSHIELPDSPFASPRLANSVPAAI